jgi:hypothetical protein
MTTEADALILRYLQDLEAEPDRVGADPTWKAAVEAAVHRADQRRPSAVTVASAGRPCRSGERPPGRR